MMKNPSRPLGKPQPPGAWVYRNRQRFVLQYLPVDPDPKVSCVRLVGAFFDTNKCFLLPSAMTGIRKLVEVYDKHPNGEMLVVGHTDTSGRSFLQRPLCHWKEQKRSRHI